MVHQAQFMENRKNIPIKETYNTNPKNPYAKTKLKSEEIVKKFLRIKLILLFLGFLLFMDLLEDQTCLYINY